MAFSEPYLMRCFDEGPRWAGKEAALGDWFVHLKSGIDVVSTKDLHTVRFSDPDTVFIPDTDDLLELMDNQIAASGFDPSQKKLRIGYEPDQGWWVEVEYRGRITQSTGGESVHTALLNAVMQMVVSDPTRLGPSDSNELRR
jgi:hypothetical protein